MASVCSDNSFGPADSCPGAFDFTILFEQSILSIGTSAILLILLPLQLRRVWRSARKTLPSSTFAEKAVLSAALCALQLALVVLWSKNNNAVKTAIPYAVVYLVATAAVLALAVLVEHDRSLRPSSFLSVFLIVSCLFDAVQVRTLFQRGHYTSIASVLSAALALKLGLLCLEVRTKRRYLKEPYNRFPPETLGGIVNRTFFWWLNPVFFQGYRSGFTLDSLCDIDIALKSAPVQSRIERAWAKYAGKGRYGLALALASAFHLPLLAVVLPRLCLVAFNYAQPLLIDRAIGLLEQSSTQETTNYANGLIGATALVYLGIAISTAMYQYLLYRFLTMVRGALISLIYATSLQLPTTSQDNAETVTLMSTDVDRVVNGLELLHEAWARVLEIAIGIWLLAQQMDAISVSPILVAVLCFTWQIWLARYMGPKQRPWIEAIQNRVGMVSSVLRNMKAIRMMGLENIMEDLLQNQRIRELQLSKSFRWMIVWINMVASMPQVLAPLVVFAAYAVRSQVDGSDPLSVTRAFTSLAIVTLVTNPTVNLLASVPALRVAEGCLDRIQKFLRSANTRSSQSGRDPGTTASFDSTGYATGVEMNTLPTPSGSQVDGPLLRAEGVNLRPVKDADLTSKNISFSIPEATLTVITGPVGSGKTTLLKALLGEIAPEAGLITVSTPSKAYCSQSPWLPNGSFREVLCGPESFDQTWYDTVVRACDLEHDMLRLQQGDASIIGSRGSVLSGGQRQRLALARAVYARKDLLLLDDVLSALDQETQRSIVARLFSDQGLLRKSHSTTIIVTHSLQIASMADYIIALDPETKTAQAYAQGDERVSSISRPENNGEGVQKQSEESTIDSGSPVAVKAKNAVPGASQEDLEDLARRTGDVSVYLYYYRSIGLRRTLLAMFILAIFTVVSNYPRVWIQWYTENPLSKFPLFLGVYIMQIMISIVPKSGAALHKILLRTIIHAPMRFFSTTDSGITLNRFSQDMTLVDAVLPTVAFGTFLAVIQCVASVIFIALGTSYMAICIPVVIVVLYGIQNFYLRTSRQLRFLDLEARSPLFTHFVETVEGLSSIRAFNWQRQFIESNLRRLDRSQKPYYLLCCIQRWLNLVLDLMVATMATILVALAFSLRSTTSGGSLGVALTAVLSFSQALQDLMVSWTQMETSLGAIARTKNLEASIAPEDADDEVQEPPPNWPQEGAIEFRDFSASYDSENLALRNVSFNVKPKQKIGIIGRTGSGKSTLVSALLRLVEMAPRQPLEDELGTMGEILIDGILTAKIPRVTLRGRLISVPQEGLIFKGSVRFNVNPAGTSVTGDRRTDDQSHDDLIISTLRKVGIWDFLEARGGLGEEITQQSLSEGQAQLLAIARAIVKKDIANRPLHNPVPGHSKATLSENGANIWTHKILLLDEATSNLDVETDNKIQSLIRHEFHDFTIITVTHRVESIVGSDMVGMMENGRLVRFGPPQDVLAML
ncbi:P-loop containing nucleoside triphosphate hydrolase protein [Xylariales sp. PMI_506]|nr:P-loop containing nucleoside triphosphate hydrolase protein [Xylariales sp. PMI_506]